MGDYLFYDGAGKIIDYKESFSESALSGNYFDTLGDRATWGSRILKYWKIVNGQPVEMTQAEKDALDAAEVQAVIDAENLRLSNLDTKISDSQVADFTMEKVDNAINAIVNLADAKQFLKRLCRYIAKNL